MWNHVNVLVALSLHLSKCTLMHMRMCTSASTSQCPCQLMHTHVQVALFFMCTSKYYNDTVKCCPARRFGLAFHVPLKQARLRLGCPDPTEPVACAACRSGIQDTGATHNPVAALLHAAAGACLVFVVCCSVGVQVVDVGTYVWSCVSCVLWCAAASP